MAPLEPDLSRALRRKPAPAGLAERILSRLPRDARPDQGLRHARLRWAWSFASVLALCLGLGAFYVNGQRVARRNETARQQLVESLAVASRQLARAEYKAFSFPAWGRVKERLEEIEASAPGADVPLHSPAPGPRI
jgi:hypothetical protein